MADVIYQVDGNPADGYRIVCEGFDVSPAVYPTLRAALTAVRTLERRDIDRKQAREFVLPDPEHLNERIDRALDAAFDPGHDDDGGTPP